MNTKVKITLITVAVLLFIIIGAGLYKTLNRQDSGLEAGKFGEGKRQLRGAHKTVVRSKVVIKNHKYFFPHRNKLQKRVDPSAMDEEIELADEQNRGMPADVDPNELYCQQNEGVPEFFGDVEVEEIEGHSAETEHN